MRIDILTLFPRMCETVLDESIIGAARRKGLVEIYCHNIRDYTTDKHRRADDYPYGGGQGMLLCAEPCARCFEAVCASIGTLPNGNRPIGESPNRTLPIGNRPNGKRPYLVYMSPRGRVFDQRTAKEFSKIENLCLLCGHYEGIDQRFIDEYVDMELSVGDYVMTGGELAALAVADTVSRLLPGVLAEEAAFTDESHYSGLLEYPQYTRPAEWHGRKVPEVLLSGDPKLVGAWKRRKAVETTALLRPDMLEKADLTDEERAASRHAASEHAHAAAKEPS